VVDRAWTAEDAASVRALKWPVNASLLRGIPWERMQRVAIVPDGVLYRLPFEALDVGGALLIERMPVSYLPSASLLFRDEATRTALAPWRPRVAAFGDSSSELRSIARALGGRAALYDGPSELKRHLLGDALAGVPVLHFATHATVDLADSNRSRIRFGSEYLFRGEVQALPLEGADLVTLPAGETEAGRVVRDEGIQSFSRAFLVAGARTTVTTLWRVEDRATAEFMRVFYGSLGQGRGKADALRDAKLDFLHRGGAYAQPKTWAAFVLNGDGDTPLRPVLSWWRVAGIAGIVAAAILLWRAKKL
jgi:CHAT domain-containing protein